MASGGDGVVCWGVLGCGVAVVSCGMASCGDGVMCCGDGGHISCSSSSSNIIINIL